MTAGLCADDTVLFLVSGGGSALFELPLIEPAEQQEITRQLLACGADIVEMNTIRKRLSAVKGGRFAQHCSPAHVFSIVLSDIIGAGADPKTVQYLAGHQHSKITMDIYAKVKYNKPKQLSSVVNKAFAPKASPSGNESDNG